MTIYRTEKGSPEPLGATVYEDGVNFALFSKHAEKVVLHLLHPETKKVIEEIPLEHRTGQIWHVFVAGVKLPVLYAYRVHGSSETPCFFDSKRLLSDPYAKSMSTPIPWGGSEAHPYKYQHPFGVISRKSTFDWEGVEKPKIPLKDLVIYEMHVRGFTRHSSSSVNHPGTYLGLIEKIPYLKELGVNCVELLPVFEFNECENHRKNPLTKERLFNFWGYSTVNFFSPMNRYAVSHAVDEFKLMVRELHRNGIEVILDVVFNHTAEKRKANGSFSFMGIDRNTYYLLDDKGHDKDFTGCGNTMKLNHPVMRQFVKECLRYWVQEMQVDGFRFDLASIMNRDRYGKPVENAPLIELLTLDPLLADTKLIAEPWDCGGLYQVGGFAPDINRWGEWNGKFRDTVRSFIKGDKRSKNDFANRLCGSQDIYHARSPQASINFVIAHDGFCLHDLVSYNQKHNLENGEHNRDGNNDNVSWNCGVEGPTGDKNIQALRLRQMKNFFVALFLAQGVPMFLMGDEQGHTRRGNNNPWCQDQLNWFLWDGQNSDLFNFVRRLIEFRKAEPALKKETFLTDKDILWFGENGATPNWMDEKPFLAFLLEGRIYAAFNATNAPLQVKVPPPPAGKQWQIVVHTGEGKLSGDTLTMPPYSSAILKI